MKILITVCITMPLKISFSESIPASNPKKSTIFEDEDDADQLFSSTKTEKVKPPPGKSLFR